MGDIRNQSVAERVRLEMARAKDLHGPLTRDHTRAFLLLSEEYGEATMELVDLTRLQRNGTPYGYKRQKLEAELVQLVAVTLHWLDNLEQERIRDEQAGAAQALGEQRQA